MITPTTRFGAHSAAMDSATSDTASNWGSFNCSFVAAAEANVASCDTNAAHASNSRAVAAERANDSRNSESNQVIAQTKKSPQLYPPSISSCASLDLLATVTINERATGWMVGAPTAASSGDALTLAQLYRPRRQKRNNVESHIICQDSNARSTP